MKRVQNQLILTFIIITSLLILCSCTVSEHQESKVNLHELSLDCSYELAGVKTEFQTQVNGKFLGTFLIMSGNIETTTTKIYKYWYRREDGGIIPASIDMSLYTFPENITIVIYEDDSIKPKLEIWRDKSCKEAGYTDGEGQYNKTEFRFTIPTSSFVNTYDLQ